MKSALFTCRPWDLLDERPEHALDRLAGEIGIDAVSVAAVAGAETQFRPHDGVEQRWFTTEAAAHFQPETVRYAHGRIRPLPGAWMKTRNPFESIARACEKRGVKLRAACAACHSETLAERHPQAACRDAFGRRSAAWLCPANPDVREYVASLVDDLSANYPLAAVELAAIEFGPGPRPASAERIGLALGPVERFLLALCTCESCGQFARQQGVDAAAALAELRDALEPTLAGAAPRREPLDDFLGARPALADWVDLRQQAVTGLLEIVRRRCASSLVVQVPRDPLAAAFDAEAAAAQCDAFAVALPGESDVSRAARFADLSRAQGGPQRVEPAFCCHPPLVTEGPVLVRRVHDAVAAGHETIRFYDYGTATNSALEWVRQAIRYARREG